MLGLEESPDFRAPGLNWLGRSCCRRSPNTAGFGTRSNVRRSMAPGIRYQSVAGSRSTRIVSKSVPIRLAVARARGLIEPMRFTGSSSDATTAFPDRQRPPFLTLTRESASRFLT
jgi:hypothetical protein